MHKKRLYVIDLIILALAILLAVVLLFVLANNGKDYSQIVVKRDGELIDTLNLYGNMIYKVDGTEFEIEIKDARVRVLSTDCPDKLCKNMSVETNGGSIVCLPNRIVIEGIDSDYDYKAG